MFDSSVREKAARDTAPSATSYTVGRRNFLALPGAAGLATGAAGCGGSGPSTADTSPVPADAGYPMTVDGIEGPVTIPTTPSRVVSVGNYRDTDAAVALGVVPLLPPDLGRFIQGGISPWVLAAVPGDPPDLIQVAARPESLATLDADVLILTFNSPEARTRLEADEMFQRIPAVQRGSYVALDLTTAIAIGFPSALSIPYALDQSLPQIAAALGA